MNNSKNYFLHLDGITQEELTNLNFITESLNEEQLSQFTAVYVSKRKKAQEILVFTILGFVIIAGIQRFVLGQIFMGVLYLFTGGFCLIGTIVDLINNKSLTNEYNRKMAQEALQLINT